MRVFVPLVKVDEESRTVYGRLTQEVADKAGEIFDYESSKPYFKAWSEEFSKLTDGKSLGNVRAMHGKVAAGKLIEIDFNDAEKAIDIGAKIVDDNEWQKCLEGVYTGYSLGGKYLKKWADKAIKALTRFTAQPSEASLVDAPCVPTARFTLVKSDGAEEEREFASAVDWQQHWYCGMDGPDHHHVAKDEARACIERQRIAKLAVALPEYGEGDSQRPEDMQIDGPLDKSLSDSIRSTFLADIKNTSTNPTHDLVAAVRRLSQWAASGHYPTGTSYADLKWMYNAIVKELHRRDPKSKAGGNFPGPGSAKAQGEGELQKCQALTRALRRRKSEVKSAGKKGAEKADLAQLTKGLYGVGRFAECLENLNYIAEAAEYEAAQEGDGSAVPGKLKTLIAGLGAVLVEMAQEETEELTQGDDVEVLELSETGEITKLQVNEAVYPALAACMSLPTGDGGANGGNDVKQEDFDKALGERDQKIEKLTTDLAASNEKLEKSEQARGEQAQKIEALEAKVEEIGKRAAPPKGRPRIVIGKSQDAGDGSVIELDPDALRKQLEGMSAEERSQLVMKVALGDPKAVDSLAASRVAPQ